MEETNRKVRANLDKDKAEEDARGYREQYNALTGKIQEVRDKKLELLKKADLPLPGLMVEDGELVYNGQKWDNMSGSEQLKVSTAPVKSELWLCAHGQAGTDGPAYPSGVWKVAGGRRSPGDRYQGIYGGRVQHCDK